MEVDMKLKATYEDNWYDRISMAMVPGIGTIEVIEKEYNGKIYWDAKWYNSCGIVVNDGCGLKTDKAFDRIRSIVK